MKNINTYLTRLALGLHNFAYKLSTLMAVKTEGGLHPKHRIMKYHDWFITHIKRSWNILDIGCGNGALTYDIGKVANKVVGVDFEEKNIKVANESYKSENITFVCADAVDFDPGCSIDCVVLSNVLEHIEDRVSFLKGLRNISGRLLIRIPMFNRDWITPYKKEMGIEWKLDSTHYVEYTERSFADEIESAGMTITEQDIMWGEIYAVVETGP